MTTTRSFVAVALVIVLAAGRVQAQADGDVICPLSEDQQEEAQNAWATVAETFKHDRCSNCHGKKNPFVEDTTHPERIRLELDGNGEMTANPTFLICQGCHSEAGDVWRIPPASMHWWNQSVEELCRTQHKLNSPISLITHSRTDPLILHAFTGLMGLPEELADEVETTPYPDPAPPGDRDAFIERMKSWYHAQDIDAPAFAIPWQGDEVDCGCVPQLYEVVIDVKFNGADVYPGCGAESHIHETIPIDFTAAGGESKYKGTGTGTFEVSNFSCPVTGCTVDYRTATTDVQLEGDVVKVNGKPSKLTMKSSRIVNATSFDITCPCDSDDCPYPVTIQVPQTEHETGDIEPDLDARLGDYDRSVPPGTLTITIRKRN
jgi:hypothetical protein